MRAARIEKYGGINEINIVEIPEPVPGKDEVLIHLKAAGLNHSDILQREGAYLGGPRPPFVPGIEGAGVIESVGGGVDKERIGVRVLAISRGGMHAEYAAVGSVHCFPLPDSLSFEEGAAFPVHYLTAYHSLVTVGHAIAGERIVVHAASGGLGIALVQIGKILGLHVIATSSSPAKREKLRLLGADEAVGFEDFEVAVRDNTSGHGVQLILDTVGGSLFHASLRVLDPLGRLVILGMSSRKHETVETLRLLYKSHCVMGFHLSSVLTNQHLLRESLDKLFAWIGMKQLRIIVGSTFGLSDIRRAHSEMADRLHFGKIILLS